MYLRSLSSRITWQSWDTQFTLRDINTTSKHRNTILAQLQSELKKKRAALPFLQQDQEDQIHQGAQLCL